VVLWGRGEGGEDSSNELVLCVARSMVSSPGGGLTHHSGSSTVSKPNEGKADPEHLSGLGTGEEACGGRDPGAEGKVGYVPECKQAA
jgi:hypothetical protein